jgi:hypothetical protein
MSALLKTNSHHYRDVHLDIFTWLNQVFSSHAYHWLIKQYYVCPRSTKSLKAE